MGKPRSGRADQGRPGMVEPVGRLCDGMPRRPLYMVALIESFLLNGLRPC
jgi:hypothetical protein